MRTSLISKNLWVAIAALGFSVQVAMAQTPGDTVPNDPSTGSNDIDLTENIGAIGVLKLNDANKLDEQATVVDTVIPIPPIDYSLIKRQVETNFEVEDIKPAKLKIIEKLDKLYNGYVRGGVGTNTMPLLDVYYNNTRSRNQSYGVYYNHLSSNGGVKDAGYSGFSENKLGLYGKHFMREYQFNGGIDWDRDVVHFYGYDANDTVLDRESTRQKYNYIGLNVGFASYFKDSADINYNGNLSYYNYSDSYDASENNVLLTGVISKYHNRELYSLGIDFDFNSFKPGALLALDTVLTPPSTPDATSSSIVRLNPAVSTIGRNWRLKLGLGIQMNITHTATFHFYPNADFRYSLFDDIFIPYAGVTGNIERNSFHSLTQENAFMLSNSELINSNRAFDIYGGIRGSISSTTSFNLRASSSKTNNIALFVNDTTYSIANQFMLHYDTATIFNIRGEFTYHKTEKLKLHFRADWYSYNMESAQFAWNLPDYRISIAGTYDLFDKIIVRADIFTMGKRKALSLEPTADVTPVEGVYAVDLDGFVDANLGFEYRTTKRFSVWVNFNNIAASKYPRWYNYRVQGFNVIGGLTYAF